MKKINLYLLAMFMTAMPLLQACDNDGYSLDGIAVSMATVKVVSGNTYYLEIDNGETLWPVATQIGWYKPIDGQRVIANYTPLSDEYGHYDHAIRVNFLSNVLTKKVENLTAENEEEIGDDEVSVRAMWVGGKYLNVDFLINLPQANRHRVSLVRNTLVEEPADDYIHLEYRYNDQDDVTGLWRRSFVSFNLTEILTEEALATYKGFKVKLNSVNGEKELTYNFSSDNESEVKTVEESEDMIIDPSEKTI